MFHKIQILPAGIQNQFLEIHPYTGGGGGTYPSWFTLPPTQDFGMVNVYT